MMHGLAGTAVVLHVEMDPNNGPVHVQEHALKELVQKQTPKAAMTGNVCIYI